jgi:hypothetical protein
MSAFRRPGHPHLARAPALRWLGLATPRTARVDQQRAVPVALIIAPDHLTPAKPERLADPKPRVEQQQHEHVELEPLAARGL